MLLRHTGKLFLSLVFFFSIQLHAGSISSKQDSLLTLLKGQIADTMRFRLLNDVSWEYRNSDPEKALSTAAEALELSKKTDFPKEKARTYNIIAEVNRKQGNFSVALDYHLRAVKIREEIKDDKAAAASYNNIGLIYWAQNNYERALEYFNKALVIREKNKDKKGMAALFNNIGLIYKAQQQDEKALDFFVKAMMLNEELGNKNWLGNNLGNIGNVYRDKKEYQRALPYYQKAFAIFKELDDKSGMAEGYINIGEILEKQGNYSEAISNHNNALQIAREQGDKETMKYAYEALSNAYEKQQHYQRALDYYKLFSAIKDTIFNADGAASMAEMSTKYETEKKQKEIELLNKDKALQDSRIKQQNTFRNFLIGVVTLILVLAFVLLRSNRNQKKANTLLTAQKQEIEKQKEIVEHQKEEITDSINYAKRIQQAILPPKEEIYKALPDSFVLYKPKDIVSGDFYWFYSFSELGMGNEQVLIAAADCTGHGVPGAFMSMIGTDKLNEAIKNTGVPGEILQELNVAVKKSLRQSGGEGETRDGMDIALCAINRSERKIQYAGANRPLWMVKKGDQNITEVKATKTAIGGFTDETCVYENHNLQLEKGDSFYIFSDGFPDQFGGPNGKKLMTKTMKEIIISIQDKTMEEQGRHLDNFFEQWKTGYDQVDDILVIGIRM